MKKLGCLFLVLLLLLTFFMPFAIGGSKFKHILNRYISSVSPNSTAKVLSYRPDIERELNKYNLIEFTPVLLAIMYQESRGEGNDPMQASESAGLKRNEIQDPRVSIQQGVFHFYQMYKLGKKLNVDLTTIIQSYNMGPGYIQYVAANGSKHSEDLAKAYSKIQVDAHPQLYTCGGITRNFRYPYCFGDFTYTAKVQKKIPVLEKYIKDNSVKVSYIQKGEHELLTQ
ncbi:lysozyme family protein [Ectobacillus panaciterrae]|uniref:lysozyme family protein n=1 Tax=Ectobacillus panaciterrae TaxID=363872 RepID=UPI0004040F05|nr:lysozyme family protein [Ectobacillus panaciterrae]